MKKKPNHENFFHLGKKKKNLLTMKLLLCFILLSILNVSGSIFSQNATFDLAIRGKTVKEVLHDIESQSQFRFLYNDDFTGLKKVVHFESNDRMIDEVLSDLLIEANLSYMKLENNLIVLTPLEKASLQHVVTGRVTDAQTGEGLPGVSIIIVGTTIGVTTDIEGKYRINVPDKETVLSFSFIGYQSEQIVVGDQDIINVNLITELTALDEIVVVGYGVQRRESVSGSVGTVQGEQLQEQPALQASASLMGRIPGVQITQLSGQPGRNTGTIRIRGIGTLGDANPLVLIDGISGSIDDVSVADIENISILKDASAAAIYGSRGANGVILITTKRGRQEPLRVNYANNIGFLSPTELPGFVDAGTYMRLENLGAENLGLLKRFSDERIRAWEENYLTDPDNHPNTNWMEETFSEQAMQNMHNLNISGGGENFNFRGSLQYDDETSQMKNFEFQRYNIRLNTDLNISDDASFTFDVNTFRSNRKEPSAGLGSITQQVFRLSALHLCRFSDGSYAAGVGDSQTQNPAAINELGGLSTQIRDVLRGSLEGKFKPIDRLELKITYSPMINTIWSKSMTKKITFVNPYTQTVRVLPTQNSLNEQMNRSTQHTAIFLANYQQDIADHRFNFLGGSEYIDYSSNWFGASRDNFLLQDFEQLNAGSGANQQNSGSATQWRLLSFFGRVDYNFRNRYMLLANMRYDGSSRFTKANRWSFFPSISAAWRISQERFMESVDFIDDLKVRASWGKIGNQSIGNYPFAAVVSMGQNFVFGDEIADGASQLALANQHITWEETTTKNIGVDMYLLNHSIEVRFDWFARTTSDILLRLPMPLIIGMTAPYQNAGVVENTGWELLFAHNGNIGSDFSYNVGFNISDVNNKVIDLYDAGPFISGNTIIKEGYPINSLYGYMSDGLFKSQNEIDNHAHQVGHIAPGDIRYKDLNNDGAIDAADRDIIGDPFPSFNYGIDLFARYKNFKVSVFFQGVGRRDVLLGGDAVWAFYNGGSIRPWMIESYWRPDQPDNTYPRLTRTTAHNNYQATDFWVYDASYLRLRNLQIAYELPDRWIRPVVERATIYISGQNLFTLFDNMPPGIDPNIPNSTYGGFFPVNRLYSFGFNITF